MSARKLTRPAGVRILVADGQTLFSAGMARLLEGAPGIEGVAAATDLDDAVRLVRQCQADVALLAPQLGEAGPLESARAIFARRPEARLVFLDDRVREGNVRAAVEARAAGYWTKYATPKEIVTAVRDAAAGRNTFCPASRRYLASTRKGIRFRPSSEGGPLARLTRRELEVLGYMARGLTGRETAARLGLAESTVDNHKSRLKKKLGLHKAVDLALLAYREGLVE